VKEIIVRFLRIAKLVDATEKVLNSNQIKKNSVLSRVLAETIMLWLKIG